MYGREQLRVIRQRAHRSAAGLIVLVLLVPTGSAAQWVPAPRQFSAPAAPAFTARPPADSAGAAVHLAFDPDDRLLSEKLNPYLVAGVLLGVPAGLLVHHGVLFDHPPCDGDINPFCPLRPYVFMLFGGWGGFALGAVIGYIVER